MFHFLVALSLCYVLIKIPFWVLSSIKGRGTSLIGGLVKGAIAYKTFGLLSGGNARGGIRKATPRGKAVSVERDDPYAKARADSQGQYLLPLGTLKRRPATRKPAASPPRSRGGPDRQLKLPLDGEWPENKPVLQRDGQYRLAMPVRHHAHPPVPPVAEPGRPGRSRQMSFPVSGEWPENKPRVGKDGQYQLPLAVRRQPRPAPPPPPAAPPPAGRSRQSELPLGQDWPENGPRLGRDGQYRLSLNVRRQPPPRPPRPADTANPPAPSPPPSRAPRPRAVQPPLPLKNPAPRRPRSPRSPGGRS
ncbi:hypothetical protein [Saccharopolyspora cebuensis]|uniref:hypothetical protein n=1 Tax=Saccharopolyspora cebuensis TaxID=418759 RepID=UPI0031E9E0C5